MKANVLVVDNIIAADDAVKALQNADGLYIGRGVGCGWSFRGGVYNVYIETPAYNENLVALAVAVLSGFRSAGQAACEGCENRHVCEIDPNLCGRWLD